MKKPKLFLMHYAGGNCYSFKSISYYLTDFEVVSLELPGRGKRINEKLIVDFDIAASDFYRQIMNKLDDSTFLIFGHSLGALLALKVCSMLEQSGKSPLSLIVSGNAGPGIGNVKNRYKMDQEQFIEEIKKLGGCPEELFVNEEMLNYFLPILRADFELIEKKELKFEKSLDVPIFAVMGDQEEYVGHISNWIKFTVSKFDFEILKGGHFFIQEYPEKIAELIRTNYDKYSLCQYK